ncbi:hybrid sensor histidine kinase/response regulator, partial [Azospirillum oleiclasticum]
VGYATFLEDLASTAEQRQYTRKLRIACRSLLAIINDVLDLSKFEAGKIEIDAAPFDLHEEIEHVISVLQPAAREKRIALFANIGPGVPARVVGDADRLRQVLLNLLSNAVKFTSHGSVTLSVAVTGVSPASATMKLVVTDTGVGIPADKHHLLFKKFSQADRRFGGTGLGLAISKHLVEAMGGSIGFQSEPGLGSTFHVTITFPVAGLTAMAGTERTRLPPLAERLTGRILLVEDVDMNQELIGRMLRNAGHRVDIAGDGEQALAAVADRAYDLVLMDLRMPVMDGFTAAAAIRALPGPTARTPILALTATVLPDDVERCRAVGMNGHIAKPVEREELLATVQHWLGNAAGRPAADQPENPVLAQLEADMGRTETAHLLDLFLEALPDRLRSADTDRPDWTRVGEDAHAMVSLAGNLGLSDLMAVSRALAEACRSGDHHRASGLLGPFRSSGEAAEAAIRAHRRSLSSVLPAALSA